MDCNVNFKGRLVVDGMTKNKARWKNIAKIFKDETKGINYESRIFNKKGRLAICVDRMERKNRKFDYIEDLTTRRAILTKIGTKELLSQSDNTIAKTLAKHLQFVKKLDETPIFNVTIPIFPTTANLIQKETREDIILNKRVSTTSLKLDEQALQIFSILSKANLIHQVKVRLCSKILIANPSKKTYNIKMMHR